MIFAFLFNDPQRVFAQEQIATKVYVYDTFTEAWTDYEMPAYFGISYNDQKLALSNITEIGINNIPSISIEQKSLTRKDLNDGKRYFAANINTG